MSKLIEVDQKLKNLGPTRQHELGLSHETKAINTYALRNSSIYAVSINVVPGLVRFQICIFFQGLCGRKAEIESREVEIPRYAA